MARLIKLTQEQSAAVIAAFEAIADHFDRIEEFLARAELGEKVTSDDVRLWRNRTATIAQQLATVTDFLEKGGQ